MSGALTIIGGLASTVLGPLLTKIIDLIPDPAEKAKQLAAAQAALIDLDKQIAEQQTAIDQTEAQSAHLFVAGWRPFVGWVCASALAWQVLLEPMLEWILLLCNVHAPIMTLDGSWITLLLVPMLGLGGAMTYERSQGLLPEKMSMPLNRLKK